jgi:hypothetical protein
MCCERRPAVQDLVERWYIFFESPAAPLGLAPGAILEGGAGQQAQVKRAQKRLAVMLRTLYAFLRLLPTHQVGGVNPAVLDVCV